MLLLTCAAAAFATPPEGMRLWYRQPAETWNEALPIGNGRLAAMVFGRIQTERIQLNEETIWAGEKRDRINPQGAQNLAEVRRLLFQGKAKEAEALAERTIISIPKRMPPYQTLGELSLLPVLPKAWPAGSIKGLRARSALEVDLSWKDGKATVAVLRTGAGGEYKLRAPIGQRIANVTEGGKSLPLSALAGGAVGLKVTARREYRISFR